jgi:protein-disulfide isomerase
VLDQYPKDVKLVYKDFPIPGHHFGRPAALAALAAGEQNKFWEYHDKVMQNASALSPQKLLDFAKELGLDMDAFQKSLADPKHEKHVDKDTQDAVSAGITGTPTIFVNGRIVAVRTVEGFKAMINEELNKKKK